MQFAYSFQSYYGLKSPKFVLHSFIYSCMRLKGLSAKWLTRPPELYFWQRQDIFSFRCNVRTGSGAHQPFFQCVPRALYSWEKTCNLEVDQMYLAAPEIENVWNLWTTLCAFPWRGTQHSDNFYTRILVSVSSYLESAFIIMMYFSLFLRAIGNIVRTCTMLENDALYIRMRYIRVIYLWLAVFLNNAISNYLWVGLTIE
jgi:hypothetical protein